MDNHETSNAPEGDLSLSSVAAFLKSDPRPTFVIDIDTTEVDMKPVYLNQAIKSKPHLLVALPFSGRSANVGQKTSTTAVAFIQWAQRFSRSPSEISSTISYVDLMWSGFVVASRWVVISSGLSPKETQTSNARPQTEGANAEVGSTTKKAVSKPLVQQFPRVGAMRPEKHVDEATPVLVSVGPADWTVASPVGELSAHLKFARSIDWANTPLGDMTTWSRELRQICNHLMANPHPAALFYGDDLTVLYNEAYVIHAAGVKHPSMFGIGISEFYAELWGLVKPLFDECAINAKNVAVESQMLPIYRNGFLEETFYTWSLTPLFGGEDHVVGFYNAPFETTKSVRSARALDTLLRIAEETQLVTRLTSFWPSILCALQDSPLDFPFALLYSVEEDTAEDFEHSPTDRNPSLTRYCLLQGTIGVPVDHPVAPPRLNLERTNSGFVPYFNEASRTLEPILVSLTDELLDKTLLDGIEWQGYGEPCREFVVCPIRPFSGDSVMGFLFVGINPRRPYDEDYKTFMQLINRQLDTSLVAVTLLEAEIQRGLEAAKIAALERIRLSEELDVQRSRLQRIAEVSPVGMFQIDANGTLLEANERWHQITSHRLDVYYPLSWAEPFVSGAELDAAWHRLSVDQLPWSGELQLKETRYDVTREDIIETWVLAAAQPEIINGKYRGILGAITDISTMKWAENAQKKRLKELEEMRRAQDNFIDITSHEMRNPLSAIIQCADGIISALRGLAFVSLDESQSEAIRESIISADTIQQCATYQKRIVDDILTISKLDSALLVITPVVVQPVLMVQQAMQIFYHETHKVHRIEMDLHIGETYRDLNVANVMLDSSRLVQILINLITNAIKFTKDQSIRRIDVSIDAYLTQPAHTSTTFDYFPTRRGRAPSDVTAGSDWGTGEILFLRFEVKDTGCGLTPEEKKKLFHRFQQASPRTHIQYGGSGLGLFISRQLAELQGGEIGVASEAGVGSEFTFYVRCRRAGKPTNYETISKQASQTGSAVDVSKTSAAIDDLSIQPNTSSGAPASDSSAPISDPRNWHILIVEDNLVNQRILAQQLKKLGCTIYVANHGKEALEMIEQSKAYRGREENGCELSVVLMDLEMPVMDGLTAVKAIRELEAEGKLVFHLPVIAVSANARVEQIATAMDSGMDSVVSKPFRIRELLPKIKELLARSNVDFVS